MKIYYIRYRDDDPAEDGIWLMHNELQFFMTEEKAQAECERRNAIDRASWDASNQRQVAKWEQLEVAFESLIDLGLDAKEVFPYHKRKFSSDEFTPSLVVDTIEAED